MRKNIKIWEPCNVYDSAIIGDNVSIGMFSEVGDNVCIGNNTRIGAQCFIPDGVIIGDNCFIGPKVCFTNDKYPPSGRECWGYTVIKDNVSIGAGSIILTGVCIASNSMVGAGSVVTKSIPPDEVWVGNPASKLKNKSEIDSIRIEQFKSRNIFNKD